MKKLMIVVLLVGALAALLAGTAMAAGPVSRAVQGFGPGMRTAGTGAVATDTDCTCGMSAGGMIGMTGRGATDWAGESEEVAALLGMTAEEIQAERLAGKSLVQIAASKNIGEATLVETILDAKQADLAALVAEGKLTQAQMDAMIEHMQAQIEVMVERTNAGPAFGQGQAGQGMMGQGFRGGRGASR